MLVFCIKITNITARQPSKLKFSELNWKSLTEGNSCDRSKKTYDKWERNRYGKCLGTQFVGLQPKKRRGSMKSSLIRDRSNMYCIVSSASTQCLRPYLGPLLFSMKYTGMKGFKINSCSHLDNVLVMYMRMWNGVIGQGAYQ